MKPMKLLLAIMFSFLSLHINAISFSYSIKNLKFEIDVVSVPNETAMITSYSYISGVKCDTVSIPDTVYYNAKPFKVVSFKDSTFKSLDAKVVTLPSTVKSINKKLFYQSKIEKISLPSTIVEIGSNAFAGSEIKEINLPASLTKIGEYAFASCLNLRQITIPKSVTQIGVKPFKDTPIQSFQVESGNEHIVFKDGVIYSNYTIIQFLQNANTTGDVELLEGVTQIPSLAFSNAYVRNVKFPASLKTICEDAFFGSSLSKVVIPATVEYIEANAFRNCRSVTELIIEDSATPLLNLKESSFNFFYNYIEKWFYDKYYYYPDNLKKIYIGRQLSSQVSLASDSLTNVTFGDNVTEIYKNWLCRKPIFPYTSYKKYFYCTKVKEVTIGKDVKYIEKGTFDMFVEVQKDSAISSLERYVVSPENQYFESIDGMLYSKVDNELLLCPYIIDELSLSEEIIKKAPNVLKNCRIGTVRFPENMTELKDSLFFGVNSINILFVPEGVTDIKRYALQGPTITKLVLPASLQRIYTGTINVTKELYCNAQTPPRLESNSFSDDMFKDTPLYVPVGTKSQYSKASVWKNFFNIIETGTGSVEGVEVDNDLQAEYYNLQGLKVAEPQDGEIVIVRRGTKVTKEIYRK